MNENKKLSFSYLWQMIILNYVRFWLLLLETPSLVDSRIYRHIIKIILMLQVELINNFCVQERVSFAVLVKCWLNKFPPPSSSPLAKCVRYVRLFAYQHIRYWECPVRNRCLHITLQIHCLSCASDRYISLKSRLAEEITWWRCIGRRNWQWLFEPRPNCSSADGFMILHSCRIQLSAKL